MLFRLKREGNLVIQYRLNLQTLCEISQSPKDCICVILLRLNLKVVRILETQKALNAEFLEVVWVKGTEDLW